MSTDGNLDSGALYRLMSWLSPSFPVGAFSYSHGIEYAVEAGLVRNEESLRAWIAAGLDHEFGPVNGAMLRAAHEAVAAKDRVALMDTLEEARAFVPTLEFELEHKAQGQAFVLAFRAAWHDLGWLESAARSTTTPASTSRATGSSGARSSVWAWRRTRSHCAGTRPLRPGSAATKPTSSQRRSQPHRKRAST